MIDANQALVARGLCVRRGVRVLVCDLDFEANYGEILVVLGPNGAGKSSLLRAVSGLLPYSGRVWLDGRPLEDLQAHERAASLSFVPQTPALSSPLSVREVVEQGRYVHARGRYRFEPLDHAATEHAMRRTDVLSLSGRPFTRLSRGEQQRVMLARALCTQARILCLDEPTASLDVAHALEFYELLRILRGEGYALVVVLHQLGDARRFGDRALMLSVDQSVRLGPVRDVVCREPVRRVYGVNLREDAGLEFDLLRAEDGTAR